MYKSDSFKQTNKLGIKTFRPTNNFMYTRVLTTDIKMINCRIEKKKYYSHREKARSHPEKYLTIILDGMDQNKTNLPQLLQVPKAVQKLGQLRTHLTGGLVHTRCPDGKMAFAFYDLMQWPHDCNLVIQVYSSGLLIVDGLKY